MLRFLLYVSSGVLTSISCYCLVGEVFKFSLSTTQRGIGKMQKGPFELPFDINDETVQSLRSINQMLDLELVGLYGRSLTKSQLLELSVFSLSALIAAMITHGLASHEVGDERTNAVRFLAFMTIAQRTDFSGVKIEDVFKERFKFYGKEIVDFAYSGDSKKIQNINEELDKRMLGMGRFLKRTSPADIKQMLDIVFSSVVNLKKAM